MLLQRGRLNGTGTKQMRTAGGWIVSVNVGRPREFEYDGRPAKSAIWKSPVAGRVRARGVNLEGDQQADRKAHGGPDKAVYAYAIEDARWWEQELGRLLQYGEFGENLTTQGRSERCVGWRTLGDWNCCSRSVGTARALLATWSPDERSDVCSPFYSSAATGRLLANNRRRRSQRWR
jgi:MOSC domain